MRYLKLFIRGLLIGATLSVPGVSGGSMAMILGIYEPLINALNGIFRRKSAKKESVLFLITFSLGALLGIFMISEFILSMLQRYPPETSFLFAGAVLGGTRLLFREINKSVLKASDIIYPLIGIAVVLAVASFPLGMISFDSGGIFHWLMQFLIGILAALALVLPGISVSQLLYVLGMYSLVLGHLSKLEFLPLLPFAAGVVLGTLSASRVIEDLLKRFHKESYLTILGFLVGSVILLLKSVSFEGVGAHCIFLMMAGFIVVYFISRVKIKNQGNLP